MSIAAVLSFSCASRAQGVAAPELSPDAAAVPLPAAPGPAFAGRAVSPQSQPRTSLTLRDRFSLELQTTFGPSAFLVPAGEAAETMADPPNSYPREWRDGGGAFGRNYGAEFVRHTTGGVAHFATAAILREDPRYYPSASTHAFGRFIHAVAFTLVDRSDSGHGTIAFSNLTGSAAAGFIGMAYYPAGFNDTTHAYQRASVEVTSFVAHNLIAEFSPELSQLAHKFHFPDRIADSLLPPDRKEP